ncbi:MAG: urease accessory protein UreE [Ferruginibacter sp.]
MDILITEKKGNIASYASTGMEVDTLYLHWYETNKRLLHKTTQGGKAVILRFLQNNPLFAPGDVVHVSDNTLIVIDIALCEVIVIDPRNAFEVAAICFEIGNKHLPLYYQNDSLLVPLDVPLLRWLQQNNYSCYEAQQRLLTPIQTSVLPHGTGNASLLNSSTLITVKPS